MAFAGISTADQHDVALFAEEASRRQLAHQSLVDRRAVEL
jgi:hypothetical protein